MKYRLSISILGCLFFILLTCLSASASYQQHQQQNKISLDPQSHIPPILKSDKLNDKETSLSSTATPTNDLQQTLQNSPLLNDLYKSLNKDQLLKFKHLMHQYKKQTPQNNNNNNNIEIKNNNIEYNNNDNREYNNNNIEINNKYIDNLYNNRLTLELSNTNLSNCKFNQRFIWNTSVVCHECDFFNPSNWMFEKAPNNCSGSISIFNAKPFRYHIIVGKSRWTSNSFKNFPSLAIMGNVDLEFRNNFTLVINKVTAYNSTILFNSSLVFINNLEASNANISQVKGYLSIGGLYMSTSPYYRNTNSLNIVSGAFKLSNGTITDMANFSRDAVVDINGDITRFLGGLFSTATLSAQYGTLLFDGYSTIDNLYGSANIELMPLSQVRAKPCFKAYNILQREQSVFTIESNFPYDNCTQIYFNQLRSAGNLGCLTILSVPYISIYSAQTKCNMQISAKFLEFSTYTHIYALRLDSLSYAGSLNVSLNEVSIDQLIMGYDSRVSLIFYNSNWIGYFPDLTGITDIVVTPQAYLSANSGLNQLNSILIYGVLKAGQLTSRTIMFMEQSSTNIDTNKYIADQIIFYSGQITPSFINTSIPTLLLKGDIDFASYTDLSQFPKVVINGNFLLQSSLTAQQINSGNGSFSLDYGSILILRCDTVPIWYPLLTLEDVERESLKLNGRFIIDFMNQTNENLDWIYDNSVPILQANSLDISTIQIDDKTVVWGLNGEVLEHTLYYQYDTWYLTIKRPPKPKLLSSWWKIVLVVVGGVIGILLISLVAFLIWRRHKLKKGYLKVSQFSTT